MNTFCRGLLLIVFCGLTFVSSVEVTCAQDDYSRYMQQCEQAKRVGNFAEMEAAITTALKHGPGNEYAWRSLA